MASISISQFRIFIKVATVSVAWQFQLQNFNISNKAETKLKTHAKERRLESYGSIMDLLELVKFGFFTTHQNRATIAEMLVSNFCVQLF